MVMGRLLPAFVVTRRQAVADSTQILSWPPARRDGSGPFKCESASHQRLGTPSRAQDLFREVGVQHHLEGAEVDQRNFDQGAAAQLAAGVGGSHETG